MVLEKAPGARVGGMPRSIQVRARETRFGARPYVRENNHDVNVTARSRSPWTSASTTVRAVFSAVALVRCEVSAQVNQLNSPSTSPLKCTYIGALSRRGGGVMVLTSTPSLRSSMVRVRDQPVAAYLPAT